MKSDVQLKEDYEAAQSKEFVVLFVLVLACLFVLVLACLFVFVQEAKGRVITAWNIDPDRGFYYKNLTKSINAEQSLKKVEKWESYKSISSRFDDEEIQVNLSVCLFLFVFIAPCAKARA